MTCNGPICTARYFSTNLASIPPTVLLPMFGTLVQSLFKKSSNSAAAVSLAMSKLSEEALLLCARAATGLTRGDKALLHNMPADIRTVYKIFDLDPKVTQYAACTDHKCCTLYPPTFDHLSAIPRYPLRCTRQRFGEMCNNLLVKGTCK